MGDKIPLGAAMNKGLTLKMGQTHVQAYTKPLLEKIEAGEIDPSFVVTHPASARGRAGDVQEVPRQGGRRHQGGVAAGAMSGTNRPCGLTKDPLFLLGDGWHVGEAPDRGFEAGLMRG